MAGDRKTQASLPRRFFAVLGPGLVTGAADDDPSGIGTYSQAGAQLGFGIGWTMLLTYPLMAAIQEISARIGRTTGHGIAGNLRKHYPNWLLQVIVLLLFKFADELSCKLSSLSILEKGLQRLGSSEPSGVGQV